MKKHLLLLLFVFVVAFAVTAYAQYGSSTQYNKSDRTMNNSKASLTVRITNQNNKEKMATVEVEVTGTQLSTMSGGMGGNHLHYQIDNGPIVVTSAKTLTFANLDSGRHTVKVTVADMNHQPISQTQTVQLNIP